MTTIKQIDNTNWLVNNVPVYYDYGWIFPPFCILSDEDIKNFLLHVKALKENEKNK